MTIRLDQQVAVVTGAGNGLGRQYALLLASLGARVVVNDVSAALDGSATGGNAAESVAEEIRSQGGVAIANTDSVTDAEGAQRMMRAATSEFGGLDILICNAGILRDKSLVKMSEADFRDVMEVHVMGAFFTVKAALPYMIEQGFGRVVLTTSQSGLYGAFGQSNYAAAKMALVGFANAAELELQRKGVLINCVAPSAVTRMSESLLDAETASRLRPGLVAPLVAYLSSRECTVSGEIFAAGGGHVALNKMVQGPGVNFEGEISIDDISNAMERIRGMEGSRGFESGPDHLRSLLSGGVGCPAH